MFADPKHCSLVLIEFGRLADSHNGGSHTDNDALVSLLDATATLGIRCFAMGDPATGSVTDSVSGQFSEHVRFFDQDAFSIWRQEAFRSEIEGPGIATIYFAGAWLEEEVLLAAIDGVASGYDVRVLLDLTRPKSMREEHVAIRRLEQHGVIITTVRQSVLEWTVSVDDRTLRERLQRQR